MVLGSFIITYVECDHTQFRGPFSTIQKAQEEYETLKEQFASVRINQLVYSPSNPKLL